MATMNCNNCGGYVGDCGHVSGGTTLPTTLSGTCPTCRRPYSVTCSGNCLTSVTPIGGGVIDSGAIGGVNTGNTGMSGIWSGTASGT